MMFIFNTSALVSGSAGEAKSPEPIRLRHQEAAEEEDGELRVFLEVLRLKIKQLLMPDTRGRGRTRTTARSNIYSHTLA